MEAAGEDLSVNERHKHQNAHPPCRVNSQIRRDEELIPAARAKVFTWVLFLLHLLVLVIMFLHTPTTPTHNSRIRSLQIDFDEHKVLFPLDSSDYAGVICAVLGLMIAAGGGIGGGGILVPIFILVMGFSPKHAIPLSNVTVFGGAVANAVLNANKRHPLADRPLVDWDLMLVMEPLTIAGALIGALLNKILPSKVLVVMLVLLLSVTAYTSLARAVKMYKAESHQLRETENSSELAKLLNDEAYQVYGYMEHLDIQKGEDQFDSIKSSKEEVDDELARILEEERKTPMSNVYMLITLFIVVLAINLMKGGGAFISPLGIICGSSSFWIANAIMFGWIFLTSFFARNYLVKRFETKRRLRYQYVEGDIQWDGRATIVYPAVCCFAGFFAGMFGIGGGIVKGPLMLAMGIHPKVGCATSACMILFTSFTATTSFIVFGLLLPDYATVCLVVGFSATCVGQMSLSYLMKKLQRNSFIAFSIGIVVLLSAVLMTIQSLVGMSETKQHHFGGICGVSGQGSGMV